MDYVKVTFTISPLQPAREILVAELGEIGYESFVDTETGMEAYIQKPEFDKSALNDLQTSNLEGVELSFDIENVPDQNWNATWEENFSPIDVDGKCYIRAPFHEAPKEGVLDLIIQPQMSFGTGHHATTFLMAKKLMAIDLQSKAVLDMGCGTGVLAILAQKRGASKVLAVDIDHWSYENTIENAKLNGAESIEILEGGVEQIRGRKFDVIIANINRNVLVNDMSAYVATLNTGGYLLLSGFFTVDNQILEKACAEHGLQKVGEEEKDTWSLLHFARS
ncbi:50S ribosomal protein L11 methyltransferase [Halocola ammonii]